MLTGHDASGCRYSRPVDMRRAADRKLARKARCLVMPELPRFQATVKAPDACPQHAAEELCTGASRSHHAVSVLQRVPSDSKDLIR